jgi:hypothetical protein
MAMELRSNQVLLVYLFIFSQLLEISVKVFVYVLFQKYAVNLSCVNPSKSLGGGNDLYGVYMRSSCSEAWPHNEFSQQVRDKCERVNASTNVSTVLSVTPVSTPDITYRNFYCAICNYHNVSEYIFWMAELSYEDTDASSDSFIAVDSSSAMILDASDDLQSGSATPPDIERNQNIMYFKQPDVLARWLDPVRPCIAEMFIDKCLPYHQLKNISWNEYNQMAEHCGSYSDFVYTTDYATHQKWFFKNAHCALCNNINPASLQCANAWHDDNTRSCCSRSLTAFISLMDFSDRLQISMRYGRSTQVFTESCPKGQVYKPETMQCTDLICPTNFELAGDVCKPSPTEAILLEIILFSNASTEIMKEIINDSNMTPFENELLVALQPHIPSGTMRHLNISLVNNTTLYIHIVVNVVRNITVARARTRLNITSLKFHYNGILLWSPGNTVQELRPAAGNNLTCKSYIALNKPEYQMFANRSLLLIATNAIVYKSDYTIDDNGMVLLCNEFAQTYNRSVNVSVNVSMAHSYEMASIILSVAGSGTLLLACIALLITYALFKELRNLPGMCIMSYSTAVAMSQLFFLVGPGLTSNNAVCTAMGFCLHFFILSQFTWSTVLATDLCRTFVLMQRLHTLQRNSELHSFLLYSLYAWGTPLIICVIAVILDQHSTVDIDYAGDRICWLQPVMAVVIAFAVPLALCLFYSLLLFIILGVSFCRESKAGAMAKRETLDKHKTLSRIQQQIKIFLGAFCLLSLSWILAFLAAISGIEWLWYVFMVVTILQGIFLFIVFVLNQKVRGLYATVCKKKPEPKQLTSNGGDNRYQLSTLTQGTSV